MTRTRVAVVLGGRGHHVVVRDDVPLAVEHEAGAGRAGGLALILAERWDRGSAPGNRDVAAAWLLAEDAA